MNAPAELPLPPHSVAAEQAVIGGLLIDPAAWPKIANVIAEPDFYRDDHRRIFRHIARLTAAGEHVDILTVADSVEQANETDQTGGLAYFAEMANIAIPAGIASHAEIIKRHALARQAQALAADLSRAAGAGGDVGDILASFEGKLLALRQAAGESAAPFVRLGISEEATEPPPVEFIWDGYVPAATATLLGAHGGSGKSYIGLMLAAAAAAGSGLFGLPTATVPAAFWSAEDGPAVLQHRLPIILAGLNITAADIGNRLHVLDATQGDPALFRERGGVAVPTAAAQALGDYVKKHGIRLLVIDNASDVFDANEIERAKVRAFIRMLIQMMQPMNGAVFLLAHVDKGTARNGSSEGYSGSTAWNNSVRSRLFLTAAADGTLRLEHQKANLTKKRDPLELIWPENGIPQLVAQPTGIMASIRDRNDTKTLLRLIIEAAGRREFIAPSPQSRNHAVRVLGGEAGYPPRKPAEVFRLLRNAELDGFLVRDEFRDANRKTRERWQATSAGLEFAGLAPSAPGAPSA